MKIYFNEKYFKEYKRTKNNVHEPFPVTYQTFSGDDGKLYFQLDTYPKNINIDVTGFLEQSSSKLQFDKETAIKLIDIIKKELLI